MSTRRTRPCDGRGMVTAELAVTTLSAFTLLVMMCWGISLVVLQLRCIDTAAAVARQTARRRRGRRSARPEPGTSRSDDHRAAAIRRWSR